MKGLLQKEASKRLGYGPSGSVDVMGHPFFKPINWKKLEARQVLLCLLLWVFVWVFVLAFVCFCAGFCGCLVWEGG